MAANINDKLKSTWNNEAPAPTTATAVRAPGAGTLACQSLNWPTDTAIDFATFGKNADGSVNQASVQEGTAIVSGNNLTSIVITSGGADQGNNIGAIVVMKPTSKGHQDLVDAVKTVLNQDGSLKNGIVTTSKIANGAVTADTLAQSAKDVLGSYSTSEVATPYKWIDGKTIYKKTINFGSLPSNGTKQVAHGITGLDRVVSISGAAGSGSLYIPLPFANPTASSSVGLFYDGSNVGIVVGSDRSGYTGYVTIEYTKT